MYKKHKMASLLLKSQKNVRNWQQIFGCKKMNFQISQKTQKMGK